MNERINDLSQYFEEILLEYSKDLGKCDSYPALLFFETDVFDEKYFNKTLSKFFFNNPYYNESHRLHLYEKKVSVIRGDKRLESRLSEDSSYNFYNPASESVKNTLKNFLCKVLQEEEHEAYHAYGVFGREYYVFQNSDIDPLMEVPLECFERGFKMLVYLLEFESEEKNGVQDEVNNSGVEMSPDLDEALDVLGGSDSVDINKEDSLEGVLKNRIDDYFQNPHKVGGMTLNDNECVEIKRCLTFFFENNYSLPSEISEIKRNLDGIQNAVRAQFRLVFQEIFILKGLGGHRGSPHKKLLFALYKKLFKSFSSDTYEKFNAAPLKDFR